MTVVGSVHSLIIVVIDVLTSCDTAVLGSCGWNIRSHFQVKLDSRLLQHPAVGCGHADEVWGCENVC